MMFQIRLCKFLVVAALVAATSPLSVAQDAEAREQQLRQQVAELTEELAAARIELVEPISVNGVELDPLRVKRQALFLMGGKFVEAKVMEYFIEEQMELAIKNGRDPQDFEIPDEEILQSLQGAMAQFAQSNPGVDFWEVLRGQLGLERNNMIHQQRLGMLFERVFFPGLPDNWPLVTREAIIANSGGQGGQTYLDSLQQTMVDPATGEMKPLPPFWTQMMRQWIEQQLRQWSDIRYPSDGLPDDQVLSVNGKTWSVEDAFEYVRPALYAQDIRRALNEVVIREALRQKLIEAGHYIDTDEFRARWDVYREPFDSTPFNTQLIATQFKGYPCLEAFRQRWRLISSFQDMIAEDLTDENLAAHGEKFKALFSDGRISVDIIPFLAKDMSTGAWRPDGMELARERAEAAFALLENGEMSFEDLKLERGEFLPNDEDRGQLSYKAINQVRQRLSENEYTDLLQGYSVANYLFYEAELGQAIGPLRGPESYFIARVSVRSPPYRPIDLSDPNKRDMVLQDYVNWRFLQWANEVLADTVIE